MGIPSLEGGRGNDVSYGCKAFGTLATGGPMHVIITAFVVGKISLCAWHTPTLIK